MRARLINRPVNGYGKVGKILLAVVEIGAIVALNIYAPGLGAALAGTLGISAAAATSLIIAIGSVAITLTGSLISSALFKPKSDITAAKINVRQEEPIRWINAGLVLQGGGVLFAEFDSAGNLWYLVVHCDSIMTGAPQVYLDTIPVTLSGNDVTTAAFTDEGKRYFKVWTHTYSESNPIPTGASELAAAFPTKWDTLSHMLVGTTYSVIRGAAIKIEDRYKVYRWRGTLGLGEPNVALLADWSNMYDPRDPDQVLGDRTTYKPSRNNELIWAWWRTHPYGRKKPESDIDWDRVAEQADICDQNITGIESMQPRYECAIAAQDNVDRASIETQIMTACDGQLVFNDDGKTWLRVGYYETPTLVLSANRDIITMESVEAQNGESETQGVIVRYIDHNANFTLQPSAPWYNPNYYDPGQGNTFLTVDIPTCYNHNQAMRLAKSIGMRSQPIQKIAPTVGLRGLRAMQERIVNINYDNTFAGDYEIVTPVEVDESGFFCSLGMVPMDENRFNLLPGEEKPKPNSATTESEFTPSLPTGVVIEYNNNRIEARFDTPFREDVRYEFQYIAQSEWNDDATDRWSRMNVDMDKLFAYSGSVDKSVPQLVRWRSVSSGGTPSNWYDPPYLVNAVEGSAAQAIYNSWIVEVAAGVQVVTIGSDGTLTIDDHTRRYADEHPDVSVTGASIATGLAAGDTRSIGYDDPDRLGGAVTYNLYEDDNDAHVGPAHPGRHYVGYFSVPTTGSGGGGGGGIPGGQCPTDDTPILMANYDRSGPGLTKPAADVRVGDWVWTQHEITMRWGAYQVEAISFHDDEIVYRAEGYPRTTAAHRFWIDGWVRMDTMGQEDGVARVAKITVSDAHTYISAGVLSHNAKMTEPGV